MQFFPDAGSRRGDAREAQLVASIDVRAIGLAVVELGGGRARAANSIDPAVGLTDLVPIGAEVGPRGVARPRACA